MKVANLVYKGRYLEAEVIKLSNSLKLYLINNAKPIQLKTLEQLDKLNKWLNNGKRVARKRKEFQTLVGLKEKLK
tara:strand:+ start:410 stop:634 length:225 start_codon:yes stop_codon:yes gene_type:complete